MMFDQLSTESAGLRIHTRLYHLSPLGTGTPMVESLTGYIGRLAEAHVVSVGALVIDELLPRIPRGAPVGGKAPKSADERPVFLNGPHTINGMTTRTDHCVRVLQALTGVSNLRSLTMLPLRGICSSQNLLHRHRSWCPRCCDERRRAGEDAIEPLLWAISAVTVCPKHRCSLVSACPHCDGKQHVLAGRSRPGRCSRCRKWLGGGRTESALGDSAVADYDLWAAENVGTLLAGCGTPHRPLIRACLQSNLKDCVADLAGGNRSQLLRATKVNERTLDAWMTGTFVPELPNLLSFCYRLRIPLLRFLAGTLDESDRNWEQARGIVSEYGRNWGRRRRRSDVQHALERALLSPQPPSLAEIATELGYKSVTSLRQHDRAACLSLSEHQTRPERRERAKLVGRSALNRMIRERIEAGLEENPPPSVGSLAIELGFSDSVSLHCRFPDLCKKLVAATTSSREERRAQSEECLRAALVENPPPTLKTIAERLHRKDVGSLRLWFPDICWRLTDRWRGDRRMRIRAAGAALEAALEEVAPVSGKLVAKRAGVSPFYLAALFPAAWRNLNARFTAAQRREFTEKCVALRREVRGIATALCHRGIYPSRRLVKSLVVGSECRSEYVIGSEIQRALTELGVTGLAHREPHP
jgi:hypothetical protein